MYTREDIQYKTAFDEGDEFVDDDDVLEYFTMHNLKFMFGEEEVKSMDLTQDDLDDMAKLVIENRWHYQIE